MGYRVDYVPLKMVRNAKKRTSRVPAFTALFLMLFFFLVFSFWPQGGDLLRELLIPGDPDTTVMALEAFAKDLHDGEPPAIAFDTFCRSILRGIRFASG